MKEPNAFQRWIRSFNPYIPEDLARNGPDGIEPVRIEESAIKKKAGFIIMVFFALFLIWGFTAPIDGGVPVPGTVVVEGSRKAVQHPSGGVVEAIRVREGDLVRAGQVLIEINPLSSDASLRDAEYQYINALASYSRLMAERQQLEEIQWHADLLALGDYPQVAVAKRLERELFRSRLEDHFGQRSILLEQAEALRNEQREKRAIQRLREEQMLTLQEEAESFADLAQNGFVPRNQAISARRSLGDAQAGLITIRADLAQLETSLTTNRLELLRLQAGYNKEVDAQLTEMQRATQTLRAKVDAQRFERGLTEIRAPVGGIVVGLNAHTVGGVISGGDVLMEIVPEEHTLIVQGAIPPHMIDKVRVGHEADIRFTAMHLRTTPVIPGRVILVGADLLPPNPPSFPDEYYLAWVETTEEGFARLGGFQIQAGMPATVLVKTGERSFMNYVIKPITDLFSLAFKET